MAIQGRWKLLVFTVMLSGIVLGGVFVPGRLGVQRPGGNPLAGPSLTTDMLPSCISTRRLATDRPFENVTKAFERQLGRFDLEEGLCLFIQKALQSG